MVKNLNTIEKSERIRLGRHVPDEQAVNTIIINASSNVIQAPDQGLYIAPIRTNTSFVSNVLCYDVYTKEVIDTGATAAPQDLQGVVETGNTTTGTVEFNNPTTSLVTTSNVGISNLNPTHTLSVGGDAYISGNLTVLGETTMISSENLRVKDAIIELGENNTNDDFMFDLGLVMTRPTSNVATAYIESSNQYVIGYTQNSASDRYITVDASNAIQMRVYGDVTANSFIGDGSFLSNVVQDTDLAANVVILRDDIQSNVNILRDEMASNTITLRGDLESNLTIIRDEMAANTLTLRDDLQSNANILRDEMSANTITLRGDLQSNILIIRDEMAANTLTLRDDLQSNAATLRGEMAANTVTLRSDLQSNATILRSEMAANTITIRGEMAANTITIRGEMAANTVTLRSDLQSNVTILRGEMAANTISIREEMQSNLALKANIESPVFTGIITGDGGGISNISLQHVTEYGDSTDRTITMSNALALITSGNVGVNTPTPQRMLHVAGDILADDDIIGVDFYGDDATFTGGLTVSKDTLIYGNLEVRGNTTYLSTQNLLVEDPILALGANNTSSTLDTGLIVLVYQGDSNVAFGYRGDEKEFIIGHTLSSPEDNQLVPDTSNLINVHVYGDVTADSFIGDGGLLSNIASNLQQIALNGNVTTETIYLENAVTGLDVSNNVLVGGNVTALSFAGDGGLLSNIASNLHQIALNGNITSETIILDGDVIGLNVTNNVLVGGNVAASSFIGDGGLLSNIASNLHQIALNGNITSETIILDGDVIGLDVTNNVLVGGNVTASSFIGDGGLLSNIASNLHQIALNGNVTTETLYLNNPVTGLEVLSNVLVSGNVTADVFRGDGGLLSNIAATLQEVSDNGNTTSNTIQFTNPTMAFATDLTSNVGVKLDQLSNVVITSPQADHLLTYDGSNWVNDFNLHNFIKVHNNTGDTLYRGNAVYIVDSFNNNVANVALAKSDSSSTMPAIGLIHEDVAPGEEGVAVAYGKVNGINTLGYTEGQTVYVSNTSAGNIMNTKPYGLVDQIQNVGICIRAHENNGVVFVTGVGRSNDIPNAPISSSPNYVYVNETNNDMKKIAPENLLTKLQTLEQVVNTGNTVSNSIEITGNLTVSQNVSIGGLSSSYIPFVGAGNYLEDSYIRKDNGNIIISANTEITGDLLVTGNSYVISSNNVVIEDRILGIANNNPSHDLDTGIIMEHPGHNIALIHHGDEDRFSMGYTQNTVTDNHVLPDSNIFLLDILGNVTVQNNLTVGSGGSYFGDGTTLTGVALETDLIDNVSRISVIESDLASNASRVGVLELDLASNASRVGVLESDLASNASRVGVLESDLASNASRVGVLELDLASNASRVGVVESDLASNASRIGVVESDLASNASRIGVVESDLASNASRVSVLESDLASNALRIGVVETDLASNASRIGVVETDLASNASRIGVVETDLASNALRIGVVETDLASNALRIDVVETDLASNASRIGVVETDLASNASRISVVETDLASNALRIGVLETDLTSNASRIGVVETDLASNALRIGVLETDLTSNASRIGVLEQQNLDDIANIGNVISNTVLFTNTDIGIVATGNIHANYFKGDGSNLTGIATTLQSVSDFGNTTSNTIQFTNTNTSLITLGSVGIANTNPTCDLAIGSNVCFNDTGSNVLTIEGNILAHRITLDSIQIASIYALEYVTQTGNTTSNTIEFTNESTGLVTTANVGIANSNPIHTLDVASNLWVDDVGSNVLYVNGNVHMAGAQVTTDGKVGISNTNPQHDLSVASNLYVEDTGSNVLVVHGDASFGSTITLGAVQITAAYTLEEVTGEGNVTSNVIQFTNSNVGIISSGGIIINKDAYACKHYSYSNVNVPTDFSNVSMTFASNVFHAKITAQLTHGNEEVSTMILDVQGGTRDGTTSSLNIASGPGSVFGNTNTKPWSGSVGTTPTSVILEPSEIGTTAYGIDLYVEYKSSATDGKLESISIGTDSVKSFIY